MATVKHVKIYNANYDKTTDYLTMQHDEFTNKPILNENGQKIPREFYLIDGINCDPYSFNQKCQAINAKYNKNNTYKEIKAHHYIVSFDPKDREDNHLTPERAQALGMELAKAAFPGHQIIVCTHPDGHNSSGNIHCHIVINSVRKLDVPREEFMERPGDCIAGNKHHASDEFIRFFKRTTMELCQREDLYQIDLLSPAKVKITDREYWAQRKGQRALDKENEKKLSQGIKPEKTKFETDKAFLRRVITSVMMDSQSYEEFQKKLFSQYGISVHESRGRISYLCPDRNKPIRGSKLGTDFEKSFIEGYFQAKTKTVTEESRGEKETPNRKSKERKPQQQPKLGVRLVVDIGRIIEEKKNRNYVQKVTVTNLQQMARTLAFLQDNSIGSLEELSDLLASTKEDQQSKLNRLKETEGKLKNINELIRLTKQYLDTKGVYKEFLNAKNKKKFYQENEAQIRLYEAARNELKSLSNGEKLPSLKVLYSEKKELTALKNEQYEDYSFRRSKYRELQIIDSNVKSILEEERATSKARERQASPIKD